MSVNITQGTQTAIKTTTDSGAEIQHVRSDGGTLGIVSNLTNGTVRISVGTINVGTVLANGDSAGTAVFVQPAGAGFAVGGTVSTQGRHADGFATVISSGTSTLGTIKPAVSGSAIYVTDLVISAGTTTNLEIASGGTSTPILGTLHFNTNGGAVMNFVTPIRTASGSALVYKQSVNGALTITCTGYVD